MEFKGAERRLSASGRNMTHAHLQTTPLYGNSTDLEYFYATVYLGSKRQPQALIVDTGSSVAAVPCAEYCTNCGNHLNKYYESKQSTDHFLYNCKQVDCRCTDNDRCRFY